MQTSLVWLVEVPLTVTLTVTLVQLQTDELPQAVTLVLVPLVVPLVPFPEVPLDELDDPP